MTAAIETSREALIETLKGMVNWNEFAESLVTQFKRKGALTDRQWDAAMRMVAKVQETAARKETLKSEVAIDRIKGVLDTAVARKLKTPQFHAAGLSFSLARASSFNAGAVYVKEGDTYLGKIKSGTFQPSAAATRQTLDAILRVAADPLGEAVKHGHLTGRCSCCNRKLTDDTTKGKDGKSSVERGIGPVCAVKYGLMAGL